MIRINKEKDGNFRTLEGKLVNPGGKVERRVVEIPLEIIYSARGKFNLDQTLESTKDIWNRDLPNAAVYYIVREFTEMKDSCISSITDHKRLTIDFYPKLD